MSRTDAYEWLAAELGVPKKHCHMGTFSIEFCAKTIEVVERYFEH